jgi:hypothetical protein
MNNSDNPTLVIGIDFGMTCTGKESQSPSNTVSLFTKATGVAFSQAPRWSDPKTFQQWTSVISELANKVPSRLAYSKTTGELQAWGLYCQDYNPSLELQELFKLNLDPDYLDPYESAPTTEQARVWYVDYLHCVYQHLVYHFSSRIPQWNSMAVEWIFSVPTTWKNPKTVADIDSLIRIAGFGSDGSSHSARVTLNEAEAAAISVARQYVQFNDVLMVCDAGGGTSDVSVLKLKSQAGHATRLDPLLPVEGGWFGSALIDMAAQQLIMSRLSHISQYLRMSPQETAQTMIEGRFERFKCSFGGKGTDIPTLPLVIPGLAPSSNFPELGIIDSCMIITRCVVTLPIL